MLDSHSRKRFVGFLSHLKIQRMQPEELVILFKVIVFSPATSLIILV